MVKALVYSTVFLLIDQISKWFMLERLNLDELGIYEVIYPFLVFKMGWNTGINFGLFAESPDIMRWALVFLAVGISGAMLYWSRQFSGRWAPILIGLVVGGALGNAIDRIRFGAVVDFLNMSCCGLQNPYVFNLADVFVFAGLIPLALFSERLQKHA
jgi:signal peptidase II